MLCVNLNLVNDMPLAVSHRFIQNSPIGNYVDFLDVIVVGKNIGRD